MILRVGIVKRAENMEQPHCFEVYPNLTRGKLNVDLTQYLAVRIEVYCSENSRWGNPCGCPGLLGQPQGQPQP